MYETEPPGLGKASDVIDKLERVCTVEFEDGHDAPPKSVIAPIAIAASSEVEGASLVQSAKRACVDLARGMCVPLLKQVAYGLLGELEAWLSREDVEALNDAILDSGASKTYVTKKVKLANAVPGEGFVKLSLIHI